MEILFSPEDSTSLQNCSYFNDLADNADDNADKNIFANLFQDVRTEHLDSRSDIFSALQTKDDLIVNDLEGLNVSEVATTTDNLEAIISSKQLEADFFDNGSTEFKRAEYLSNLINTPSDSSITDDILSNQEQGIPLESIRAQSQPSLYQTRFVPEEGDQSQSTLVKETTNNGFDENINETDIASKLAEEKLSKQEKFADIKNKSTVNNDKFEHAEPLSPSSAMKTIDLLAKDHLDKTENILSSIQEGSTAKVEKANVDKLATNSDVSLDLNKSLLSDKASKDLGQMVAIMLKNGNKQATIQLKPETLGKLNIKIELQDDKANIYLHTSHEKVTEIISESIAKLHESFNKEGIKFLDVNISTGRGNESWSEETDPSNCLIANTGLNDIEQASKTLPLASQYTIDYFV